MMPLLVGGESVPLVIHYSDFRMKDPNMVNPVSCSGVFTACVIAMVDFTNMVSQTLREY